MSKNRDKGNIIFFVGVIIFVIALAVGFFSDVSAVLIDIFMGVGLVIEFIGLCICYKKDKNEVVEKKEEDRSLKEEKVKVKQEKHEDVVEVVKEEKKPVKKTTTKKETTKSDTSKKNTSNKKKNTKKSTTKKNNTKKSK